MDSLPVGLVLRTFVHYLIAYCSRPEAASDAKSGRFVRLLVPDQCVKSCYPRLSLKRFLRNSIQSHRRRNFRRSYRDNVRPKVVSNVISGVAVERAGIDVSIKFGDYRSNRLLRRFALLS